MWTADLTGPPATPPRPWWRTPRLWLIQLAVPAVAVAHWLLAGPRSAERAWVDAGTLAVVYAAAIAVGRWVERERQIRRGAGDAVRDARLLSRRLLAAQEEERRRLAQRLHDDPLQHLVYLTRSLDDLSRRDCLSTPLVPTVRHGGELAAEAVTALREVIHGLRPPVLDDIGLLPALRQLVAGVRGPGLPRVSLRHNGTEPDLPAELKLAVYRIAQEALDNAVRHARARQVTVRIRFGDPLELSVTDDGRGLAGRGAPRRGCGLGLARMRERATLAGGTLTLRSRPPHGTTVRAVLPAGVPLSGGR